jgi:hypothetical protein
LLDREAGAVGDAAFLLVVSAVEWEPFRKAAKNATARRHVRTGTPRCAEKKFWRERSVFERNLSVMFLEHQL